MNAAGRVAALALVCSAALAPASAWAAEGTLGFLSGLSYGFAAGELIPEGPQGVSLAHGPYLSANVHRESAAGMQLGAQIAYASSDDIFRQRFLSLTAIARLSPVPEDYRAFVQLSAGLERVTFDPKIATLTAPASSTRPGGSFGIGYNLINQPNFAIGGIVTYEGVIIGRNDARSYMVLALNVTLKPASGY